MLKFENQCYILFYTNLFIHSYIHRYFDYFHFLDIISKAWMDTLRHIFSLEVELPGGRNRCNRMLKWNFYYLSQCRQKSQEDRFAEEQYHQERVRWTHKSTPERRNWLFLSIQAGQHWWQLMIVPASRTTPDPFPGASVALCSNPFSREELPWEGQWEGSLELLHLQDFPQHLSQRVALAWPFLPNEELINGQCFCQNIPLGVPRCFQIYTTVWVSSFAIFFSALSHFIILIKVWTLSLPIPSSSLYLSQGLSLINLLHLGLFPIGPNWHTLFLLALTPQNDFPEIKNYHLNVGGGSIEAT